MIKDYITTLFGCLLGVCQFKREFTFSSRAQINLLLLFLCKISTDYFSLHLICFSCDSYRFQRTGTICIASRQGSLVMSFCESKSGQLLLTQRDQTVSDNTVHKQSKEKAYFWSVLICIETQKCRIILSLKMRPTEINMVVKAIFIIL